MTDRKRNELDLEEARDQAIVANRLKSQFVANVTHEVRTPLSGVLSLAEILARDQKLDGEAHETAVRIFEASKRLLGILNDLLDFAKLEAGKVGLENIPYSLNSILDDVVGLTRPLAESKHLKLSVQLGSLPVEPHGDPHKIRQVLLNLVHNAIKFTPTGAIEIAVEQRDQELYFSVTDTGIGISVENQESLFQPFYQGHSSTARVFGGTGLGLAIVNQYVQVMGGKLGLFSEVSRGTTFWFTLPQNQEASMS